MHCVVTPRGAILRGRPLARSLVPPIPSLCIFFPKARIGGKIKDRDNRINIEIETRTEFDDDTVYIKIQLESKLRLAAKSQSITIRSLRAHNIKNI